MCLNLKKTFRTLIVYIVININQISIINSKLLFRFFLIHSPLSGFLFCLIYLLFKNKYELFLK